VRSNAETASQAKVQKMLGNSPKVPRLQTIVRRTCCAQENEERNDNGNR
jgi:hypothetical protein